MSGSGPDSGAPAPAAKSAFEWQWGWALAVAANLPVPLALGTFTVVKGGAVGMFAGVIAFWLVGAAVIARVPPARSFLVTCGLLFAITQFAPVTQFMAGAAALDLCAPSFQAPEFGPSLSEPTAFLVTLVTGGLLLVVALAGGLFIRLVGWLFVGSPQRPTA